MAGLWRRSIPVAWDRALFCRFLYAFYLSRQFYEGMFGDLSIAFFKKWCYNITDFFEEAF